MITKEEFVKSLDLLQKYSDWEHKLYELGVNFWEREELAELIENYIYLLENMCNDFPDDYNSSNISYFIYETEFGTKADEYFITDTDGTEVKFRTSEDLWNYLVELHPEIESNGE